MAKKTSENSEVFSWKIGWFFLLSPYGVYFFIDLCYKYTSLSFCSCCIAFLALFDHELLHLKKLEVFDKKRRFSSQLYNFVVEADQALIIGCNMAIPTWMKLILKKWHIVKAKWRIRHVSELGKPLKIQRFSLHNCLICRRLFNLSHNFFSFIHYFWTILVNLLWWISKY